jgi:hypothetical protein
MIRNIWPGCQAIFDGFDELPGDFSARVHSCGALAHLKVHRRWEFFCAPRGRLGGGDTAFIHLHGLPPCSPSRPIGLVNDGIDEPVSVIPSMQNQAFFMLCDYIFLKEKHV